MHPRTREILDFLDATRADLHRAVDDVPEALRERRPAPERWSAAEVVEHLSLVEGGIAKMLARPLSDAGLGEEHDTSPVLGTLPVHRIVNRSRGVSAVDGSHPRGELGMNAAWAALDERRSALLEAVRAADGRAIGAIRFPHPVFGELNAYQWLVFVGAHEARHTAQIREIAESVRGA